MRKTHGRCILDHLVMTIVFLPFSSSYMRHHGSPISASASPFGSRTGGQAQEVISFAILEVSSFAIPEVRSFEIAFAHTHETPFAYPASRRISERSFLHADKRKEFHACVQTQSGLP